uniref:Uncharacterized protein n=1 Tax=Rhizophora mucronata TaxID=61149 RepID=A0A2P2Q1K8_RHIMU
MHLEEFCMKPVLAFQLF